MQVTIYWIENPTQGRIGIMPRPRGGDWLEDEVRSLQRSGVDVVVSLLERHEVEELDLQEEQAPPKVSITPMVSPTMAGAMVEGKF